MSAQYKLYKISDNINEIPKSGLMPRFVSKGTVDLKQIAKQMAKASSLTEGDIYAVIINLRETIVSMLEDGYTVKIDELGSFSITVESRLVQSEKEIRAGSVKFKRVVFKTARSLNERFKGMLFKKYRDSKQ